MGFCEVIFGKILLQMGDLCVKYRKENAQIENVNDFIRLTL